MHARSLISVLGLSLAACCCVAESPQGSSERKIIERLAPIYPEMARSVNLSGTVKLIVTVSPSGSVKSVTPLGGNPVFIRAAQDAVTKWKFAPATAETRELIELHFGK
jgi:TonB family protein